MIYANDSWLTTNFELYIPDDFIFRVHITYSALSLPLLPFLSDKKKITTKVLGRCKYTISSACCQKSYRRERVTFCGYSDLSAGKFLQSCQNIYPKPDTSFLKKNVNAERMNNQLWICMCTHKTQEKNLMFWFFNGQLLYPFHSFFLIVQGTVILLG